MSKILEWLEGGDLRSDGLADRVAELVLQRPELIAELIQGLHDDADLIRGRSADALEKVARARQDLVIDHLPALIRTAREDPVPMVRFHLAMTFGHLACYPDRADELAQVLIEQLEDRSAFVRSWAVASLAILGRRYPSLSQSVLQGISGLLDDRSIAVRTRARVGLDLLTQEERPFPPGWVKAKPGESRKAK